jgi:hypothetical protein
LLRGTLQVGGTMVLASAVVPAAEAAVDRTAEETLRQRADRLAAAGQEGEGDGEQEDCRWVNGAFRRGAFANGGGGGAFRNAAAAGGAFRNAAAAGGGGGAFRNAAAAGGYGGGGFRNGAFRNF